MDNEEVITLSVCRELLATQEKTFTKLVQILTDDIKCEIRLIKTDINDLKASAQFSNSMIEELKVKVHRIEGKTSRIDGTLQGHDEELEGVSNQMDYLENQSRRNNIKIIGVPESHDFKETWEQSEDIVKNKIKTLLNLKDEMLIERAHRVGKPIKEAYTRRDGSRADARPRAIVAKFASWKQREKVLESARKVKPDGIKFVADVSQRVLDRRHEQIPKLVQARENGKLAYFVLDRLVVKDKPPDVRRKSSKMPSPDPEITIK